jgi:lactoylglutathione lyase
MPRDRGRIVVAEASGAGYPQAAEHSGYSGRTHTSRDGSYRIIFSWLARPLTARLGLSRKEKRMRYLHTMVRVSNMDASLDFYCRKLGMVETRRVDNPAGRFTLVFLAAGGDEAVARSAKAPLLELTYNWDPEDYGSGRNFGHLAFEVDDIYAVCAHLAAEGVVINRPPRDGRMAFVRSPDNISIELLQKGVSLPKQEPWASMANTGVW